MLSLPNMAKHGAVLVHRNRGILRSLFSDQLLFVNSEVIMIIYIIVFMKFKIENCRKILVFI